MGQEQTIRITVERKQRAGCGTTLAVLILIGLAVKYWYVALVIAVMLVAIGLSARAQQQEKELEKKRHRAGPRDPWLNEVAVSVAELGLIEVARNTDGQLGGAPLEGDIGVQNERLLVYVNLFSDAERARQADIGLRAIPKTRGAIATGRTVVKADDRVLYVANGRGGVVDEFRLDEVILTVGKIATPPPLQVPAWAKAAPQASAAAIPALQAPTVSADALEQLRKLGELRSAGVLTEGEFEVKKGELLRRV